jgi:hypothetical protein
MDKEQETTSHIPIESDEIESETQRIPIRRKYSEPKEEDILEDETDIFDTPGLVIREKEKSHTWAWLLAGLIFVLFVGFGYSSGWFDPKSQTDIPTTQEDGSAAIHEKKLPPLPKTAAEFNFFGIESGGEENSPIKTLVLKGELEPCTSLKKPLQGRESNLFGVVVEVEKKDKCSATEKQSFEERVILQTQNLPNGNYQVSINGKHKLEFSLEGQVENFVEAK